MRNIADLIQPHQPQPAAPAPVLPPNPAAQSTGELLKRLLSNGRGQSDRNQPYRDPALTPE